MIVQRDGTRLRIDMPARAVAGHTRCAAYATYHMTAPLFAQPGPPALHLGFYGYLRVCDVLCIALAGVSIFDLSDATWRDWYEDRKPPEEAVLEILADNGFTSGAEPTA